MTPGHDCLQSQCTNDHAAELSIEAEDALMRSMKPCAYCGGRFFFDNSDSAMCDGCGMFMPGRDLEDVVAKVNRRFVTTPTPAHGGYREGYREPNPGI